MSDEQAPDEALGQPAVEEPKEAPPPYVFSTDDVHGAAQRLDTAYAAGGAEWHAVVDVLRPEAADGGPAQATPLDRALQAIVLFDLRIAPFGEPPGCTLGPQYEMETFAYPARIAEVTEDEVALWMALADAVTDLHAQARMHDLLFERRIGNRRTHAEIAAGNYLSIARAADELDFGVVEYLIRAWHLCRAVGLWELHRECESLMIDIASRELASSGDRPGLILPLLGAACAPPPHRQPEEFALPADEAATLDATIDLAASTYVADNLVAETMSLLRSRASNPQDLEAINRREAELHLTEALKAEGLLRQHRLQATINVANRRGVFDVAERATQELQSVDPRELGMQRISSSVEIPADKIERYVEFFLRSPDWRDCLRLFKASECPTGLVEDLRRQEQELAQVSVFRRLFPRTFVGGDGLPRWSPTTPEEETAAELAWIAGVRADFLGNALAEMLRRFPTRYEVPSEGELTAWLSDDGRADVPLNGALAHAFRLYWAGDFTASVHVIVPKIEAACRALLLELDAAVYRIQAGRDPGGYIGLYNLVDSLEELALDPDWAYFLRWLFLGPAGRNLRNEVAHGMVTTADPITAALCLRAGALLIPLVAPGSTPTGWEDTASANEPVSRSRDELIALLATPALPFPYPLMAADSPSRAAAGRWIRRCARQWIRLAQRVEHRRTTDN